MYVYIFLGKTKEQEFGISGQVVKLWEGDQEKYGKQGLFGKVCYVDFSLLIRAEYPLCTDTREGDISTTGNFLCK
jgi:hypothetical protein